MEKVAEPIKISLAAARVNARKTQAQLAEEMEISRMTLANLENGKTQISKAQLHLFCELCNIPVANIFLPYKFSEWKQLSIRGGERVSAWIPLIILYVLAGICILVMRKIQPDNKEYLIYVVWTVFVCIAITFFVVVHGLRAQVH